MLKQILSTALCATMLVGLVACAPADSGSTGGITTGVPTTGKTDHDVPTTGGTQPSGGKTYTIGDVVRAYVTDRSDTFTRKDDYAKVYDKSQLTESGLIITINDQEVQQEMHGFGASFTDTATWSLMQLSVEDRNEAMMKLFDSKKGIGLSVIRNCIGASDFYREYYTYDDMPVGEEDRELANFSMERDADIMALTKQALDINPDAKVILAPWTAPLWMKYKYDWTAKGDNRLRRDCYGVYAQYLVKAIQGYEAAGIPVYAINPQNEMFAKVGWPSMYWDVDTMSTFISDYLRPALDDAGLKTKILVYDHNFDNTAAANAIFKNCFDDIDGIGYHDYAGNPEDILASKEILDGKLMYVTEASNSFNYPRDKMTTVPQEMIRAIRSGAQAYVAWNMAVRTEACGGGPTYNGVNSQCSGPILVDTTNNSYRLSTDFYIQAHFSKYIQEGARLLSSTDTGANSKYELVNMVVANPDGTMVAIVVNCGAGEAQTVKLVLNDRVMEVTVQPRSVATLYWNGNT